MEKTQRRGRPVVSIVTAHGRQELPHHNDERVIDLLQRHRVPWSAVSLYAIPRDGGQPKLYPCLDRRLSDLDDVSELLLYFSRNVNPFIFSLDGFKTVAAAAPAAEATEYFYQRLDNERSTADVFLKKLSAEECRSIVAGQVADTVRNAVPCRADVVVGVSGGGDSNALLHGLSCMEDNGVIVHPVILKGIPDWDQGVPRARELCKNYGLDLTVIEEDEVKGLLGMQHDSVPLIERFEREFEGDDFEFLGTLLIRLALQKHALELGTRFICTGLNLEDVLCESMFRLANGSKPAPFPVRQIGDMTLVMPLWLCPKRIIDGCFPRYSLDNYDARYPCFSLGRNLYYSSVYALQSELPAFAESFAHGLSALSMQDPIVYAFDEQLGFHVERFVPFPLRRKFQRMLGIVHA